jgi:hypothetical protein
MPAFIVGALLLFSSPVAAQPACTANAPQIVDDVYQQVLERSADAASASKTEALSTGQLTVRELAAEVAKSPEHRYLFFWRPLVLDVYSRYMQRAPSQDEERRAAAALTSGQVTLDEFIARTAAQGAAGQPEPVRILYRRLLGREPDPDGLQNFTAMAQRNGIEAVAQGLVHSEEYQKRVGERERMFEPGVRALYRHLLGRDPDPGGLQAQMQLAAVYDLNAVVDRIVESREYAQQYGEFVVPGRPHMRYCGPEGAPRVTRPRGRQVIPRDAP